MITENFPIEKKEKSEFPPLPENMYQVELIDVNASDNETYDSKKDTTTPKEFEKQLSFQFVLLNGTDIKAEKEEFKNLRGRNIWANFIPSYLYVGNKGPNKLYQIIHALVGRELTQEEEATFDSGKINELVGMQCRIATKNKAGKESGVFSNIETYYAKEADVTPLTAEEKEKATVKKDTTDQREEATPSEGTMQHHQAQPQIATEEEEIKIEDIPY